ncbi:MAG: cytidylate kinase-like family protein [Spirochaetaceae bacterium]|jgi:cytidylate kinase|nr:cytidylate kinase-like family protein [Spirochaetaceae bacterium]
MAIITISRELAALGDEIAYELANLLGYRFVNKSILEERIKSYGLADHKFQKYDERKPSFWASLSQDRDDYLHYLKTAVLTETEHGDAVVIGRGAAVLFRDVPGALSVFLGAPMYIRIERTKSYYHCDDKRAKQIIDRSDKDRKGFHHYFFDAEWRHPGNYHLALNTGHLRPGICAEIIKYLRDQLIPPEVEERSALRLKELLLAHQIKHHILYDKDIPIHFLETEITQGQLALYGVANAQSVADAAVSAAQELIGPDSIRSEIQIVQEYNVIP